MTASIPGLHINDIGIGHADKTRAIHVYVNVDSRYMYSGITEATTKPRDSRPRHLVWHPAKEPLVRQAWGLSLFEHVKIA